MAYDYYKYNPSLAAAITATALFSLSTSVHIAQMMVARTWFFIPFVIGGTFEALGYTGRSISSSETPDWTLAPYLLQSLLILLAPAFFAASIYMAFSRIIRMTNGESLSLIRVNWLTKIFVTGDIISFLVQAAGGGILANADTSSERKNGERVITIGLIVQLVFFGIFILVALNFHHRLGNHPNHTSKTVPWKSSLIVLYIASMLIMVRSVFRVIEYVQGEDGALLRKEIWFTLASWQ
ncbi:related to protein RTA1 [Neofusicoccum parvum]|nr:related to protein RTA1 [Neofusicoccum parvum]